MTEYQNRADQPVVDLPEHVNDRQGIVSLFLMGLAIVLLLLLVIAVVQAI
jgi:hypothetical protein